MKKFLLSIVLVVFMLTAIFTVSVSAEEITVRKIASGLEYDWIGSFSEGLAVVRENNKYGYIDKTGKVVIPLEYDCSYNADFKDGLALVTKLGNEDGSGERCFIDKNGEIVISLREYIYIEPFSEGMAAVAKGLEDLEVGQYSRSILANCGFIDKTGTLAIPCEYGQVSSFSEGLAAVRSKDNNKWGYIDNTGKLVVPFEYDRAADFSEGLALVSINSDGNNYYIGDKYGFIDKTGKVVVPLQYDVAGSFNEGMAGVSKRGDKGYISGYIDKTGELVVPFIYDSHAYNRPFNEGLVPVLKDGKWGYINKTGEVVIPFEYNYADNFSEGMAIVHKWDSAYNIERSFIDKTGKLVIPFEYDQVVPFKDGLALVRKDDEELLEALRAESDYIYSSTWNYSKWGYIDKTGKVVVPIEYDEAWNYSEGMILVQKDDKWSILQVITTKNIQVTFGATRYILNHEPFEQDTLVYDGAAYLPAAYLAEKLGLTAQWDAETNTTMLTSTRAKLSLNYETSVIPAANPVTKNIKAVFGATQYILNGEPFDEQTIVYDGVAYLPAAYLAEKLGLKAEWNAETNITTLTSE